MLLRNVEENLNIKLLGHDAGFFKFICVFDMLSIKIAVRVTVEKNLLKE